MSNDELTKKLKEILINMNNTEVPLEEFYEVIERETGGRLTFSIFKNYLDRYYGNINKSIKLYLY